MSATSDNNKRIAKNTLMLYFRQILVLVVSLYTSRVILNVLGVDDYGIYNVVGGIVTMFSFITGTMASASQRFLSYDLAKNDPSRLRQTFSLIMLSYLILIVVCLVLSEAIAVWFLNAKMNIPADRLEAANWVLQFSILSFVVNIFSAPYMSVIISRERMSVYAYASIVEVVLRLINVYMLTIIAFDKLKVFAVLCFISTFLVTMFYRIYCKRHFAESHYTYFFHKERLKEICSFASWNIVGSIANVLRSQGLNILLNLFFNPAVNAARGIAYQVNTAIMNFSNNFYSAVKPQLTKNFASDHSDNMIKLGLNSSRYAYFLMLVISVPILIETKEVLVVWLKIVPDYAVIFIKITLIQSLLELVAMPLTFMLQASGKIKQIQLTVSILYLLNIPISYIFLELGYPPTTVFYVNAALVTLSYIPRLVICKRIINLKPSLFLKKVILNISAPTLLLFVWGMASAKYGILPFRTIPNLIIHLMISFVAVALIGVKSNERTLMLNYLRKKIKHG